jgi:hypothetical protein
MAAPRWPLLDALTWVATGEAVLVARLIAVRDNARRSAPSSAVSAILRDAVRDAIGEPALKRAESDFVAALRLGDVVAFGRSNGGGPPTPILATTWDRFSVLDYSRGTVGLASEGETWFSNVVVDGAGMLTRWPRSMAQRSDTPSPPALSLPPAPQVKRTGGRPPSWDWPAAQAALADWDALDDVIAPVAHGDGKQAALETWLTKWFEDRNNGRAPSESEVRKRVSGMVQARRERLTEQREQAGNSS